MQTDTLDMHIFPAEIASIYAVEKRGHDSEFVTHSFQFFDRQGDAGFKAFLWENYPKVSAARIESFMSWPAIGLAMTLDIKRGPVVLSRKRARTMARRYLAFDIETAKDVPGEDFNWRPHRPLGISCAATLASPSSEVCVVARQDNRRGTCTTNDPG